MSASAQPQLSLTRLREFVTDYVNGEIPELSGMDYLRVDYCHNFQVGPALADYVHTLSKVSYLRHRRTTDGYGGVEWWSKNGRMIRVYDKFKEILEKDKKTVAEARGILRFEIQHRKKSGFLQRRQHKKKLTLQDVLRPEIAYCSLVETLNAMCMDVGLRICTETWRIAGLRLASSRWDWMRREWAGIHSSVSAKHGYAVTAAWKTSTTSGWHTSRKPCPRSTHTFTRNSNCASTRPSE